MNTEFVPSGEVAAILSQLASSRMDLKKSEGLNGIPDRYFTAKRYLLMLGLSDEKNAIDMMSILESEGIAMAMASAQSLDRFASVIPNSSNVLVTRPQSNGLSQSGASPQGYTRPYEKDEGKHDRTGGTREDLSPSSDLSGHNQGVGGNREGLPPYSDTPALGNGGFHG